MTLKDIWGKTDFTTLELDWPKKKKTESTKIRNENNKSLTDKNKEELRELWTVSQQTRPLR